MRTRRLVLVRRGVYLVPGVDQTWETAVMAAVLVAGDDAVASHSTAARLWGLLDEIRGLAPDDRIHVTAPGLRRLPGVSVHVRALPPSERTGHVDVTVTTVARTLFDLATVLDAGPLGRVTDEALRRRIVDLAQLRRLVAAHGGSGRRRIWPLHQVLAERLPGYDPGANEWELSMDRLWDSLGLPAAERQCWIRAGGRRYRVDRAIVDLRIAVEWVGAGFHGQLDRYRRDRLRISDLAQVGWLVIDIPYGWPERRIRDTVMAAVEQRRATPA